MVTYRFAGRAETSGLFQLFRSVKTDRKDFWFSVVNFSVRGS